MEVGNFIPLPTTTDSENQTQNNTMKRNIHKFKYMEMVNIKYICCQIFKELKKLIE